MWRRALILSFAVSVSVSAAGPALAEPGAPVGAAPASAVASAINAPPVAPASGVAAEVAVEGAIAVAPAAGKADGAGPAPLSPLPADVTAAFLALREDPAPAQIVRDSHYWISNEYRHDVVRPTLEGTDGNGVGGILMGVGTDQNYLMAAWARSELLVLMDFDSAIPRLHRMYGHAFESAGNPSDFMAFWDEAQEKANLEWIREVWPEGKERDRMLQAFRTARPLVRTRLRKTLRDYGRRGVSTFLDDPKQYQHLRDLWLNGRVFAVRGDLTADQTVKDIGDAARKAGLAVRVVYLSNAPQYFDFGPSFRANMAALPMDERSWFVHTLTRSAYGYADGYYHYNVQSGPNFQQWLRETTLKKLTQILKHRTPTKVVGFSVMDKTPVDAGLL
jgi:hypothetical protein